MPKKADSGYAGKAFIGDLRAGIKAGQTPKEAVRAAYAKKTAADAKAAAKVKR